MFHGYLIEVEIVVESVVGQGTVFFYGLPIERLVKGNAPTHV